MKCFSTSEACIATAVHEQGTSCLHSGGGKMVVVDFEGAAMLCMGVDTVSADRGPEVYADTSADKQQHQWHELMHIPYEHSI